MNKRGQGLSLTTIIVAAIGLIVLVVLVAIFTGRIGIFGAQTGEVQKCSTECTSRGFLRGVIQADGCGVGTGEEIEVLQNQFQNRHCCCKTPVPN